MLDWPDIDTVLLDMDGTLLDLRYDNHFWLEHLPRRYAEHKGLALTDAHAELQQAYQQLQGSLNWYCLDYWRERLQLPLLDLKTETADKIRLRPDALPLLQALGASGRPRILLTNAHPDAIALKFQRTGLGQHLEQVLSTHSFGAPKEDQRLWQRLRAQIGFDPARTLLIDDNEAVLKAARLAGVRHLLAVPNPDSGRNTQLLPGFINCGNFIELLPAIGLPRRQPTD
jgi:5'-nucleotidase